MAKVSTLILLLFTLTFCFGKYARAQTTEFTFQGNLKDGTNSANGNYDLEFALYDALSVGTQLGSTLTRNGVAVANGVFSVTLDFGSNFPGADRFLEIRVRPAGVGGFTTLAPRQKLASSPYAVKSINTENATTAANATQLGGVSANQYVLTTDPRMADARPPAAGSSSYIQNQNAGPQPSSNFYIGGIGRASIFNASSGFYTSAGRILGSTGANSSNLFVGVNAGGLNSAGTNNTFAGTSAGLNNIAGIGGSFFGFQSGFNATGSHNAFFGLSAGETTTSGERNSFFGANAGFGNTTGSDNSLFGFQAGIANTIGGLNTFIGFGAGGANKTGSSNTLLGAGADFSQSNLGNATAIGARAFVSQSNSLVLGSINGIGGAGVDTNVGIGTTAPAERLHVVGNGLFSGNLTVNGALTGTFSVPATNISGVLATLNGGTGLSTSGTSGNFLRSNGTGWASSPITSLDIPSNLPAYVQNQNVGPQASSNFNISGNGRADVFDAGTQFNIGGNRVLGNPIGNLFVGADAGATNSTGTGNVFVGREAGESNTTGTDNSFFGTRAGQLNSAGAGNSFFGERAGNSNTGSENSFFGRTAGTSNISGASNSYFGFSAGFNSNGSENAFFGANTGPHHTSGSKNTYVGTYAGTNNSTGNFNTAIGYNTRFNVDTMNYATVIGADATAMRANSITLGRNDGSDDVIVPGALSFGGVLSGNGSGLTNLNADNITTGILDVQRLANAVIFNTSTQQPSSNFNISGTGAANIFNAETQYNIGGNHIMSQPGVGNLFVGSGAGFFNSGGLNSFFGRNAGLLNNTGVENSFFGYIAGKANTTGGRNSFFGMGAGQSNTTGGENSFFGAVAGLSNTTGSFNSFFGKVAGSANTTGDNNSFFGNDAGTVNTTGSYNSFFGVSSGGVNTTGIGNAFFGRNAGLSNTTGNDNTIIGTNADLGSGGFSFATAIGARSFANCSDCVVLGAIAGENTATTTGKVGIGTSNPISRLDVRGSVFIGLDSIPAGVLPNSLNIGVEGPNQPYNTFFIDATTDEGGFNNTSVLNIGGQSWPGAISPNLGTSIRFLTAPRGGGAIERMRIYPNGFVEIPFLDTGSIPVCFYSGANVFATCGSSIRYKTNVTSYQPGLGLINRLRPVSFDWKRDGTRDMGLIAEEVAEVEPLLVTYKNGEIEGVKYDRVGVVAINAIKEQQAQIEAQQKQLEVQGQLIKSQKAVIDRLSKKAEELEEIKKLVCTQNRKADICKQ